MNYLFINEWCGRWLAVLTLLCVSGCASLPAPDPAPRLVQAGQADFMLHGDAAAPRLDWWSRYHDAQLDRLIAQALEGSPSMARAEARVRAARAAAGEADAEGGASLSANASASRQLYSQTSIYPPPVAGNYRNSGLLHLDFAYDFDFWGRHRKALEGALGREAAARADGAAAALTLSASVATVYFQWQAAQQRLALTQDIATAQQRLLAVTAARAGTGIASQDDVQPLYANAEAPRQNLVALRTRTLLLQNQLHALLGPETPLPVLQAQALPADEIRLPGGLSLDRLAWRPDVVAARDRVEAALADVDSARAAFYPDFSLSAFIGLNSLQMDTLLHSASREQAVTPALHLPLFDAGRLRSMLDSQRAAAALAVADYDQAVTDAVKEVNDAMLRLQGSQDQWPALRHQLAARERNVVNAMARQAAGLADQRDVQQARLAWLNVRIEDIDRQEQTLMAQIDLSRALGGGYDRDSMAAVQREGAKNHE